MNCKQCTTEFEITDSDRQFYKKMDVPEPTFCPDCRQQRRLSFRNERNLYRLKSSLSGKDMLSNYSPEKPYIVYHANEWWSDDWDPLDYGKDFDFSNSFFEQFKGLMAIVPRPNLFYYFSENSEYTNHCYHNKDCYMLFNSAYCNDVYFSSNLMVHDTDCIDCMTTEKSELLYECAFTKGCYRSNYLTHCNNCSDSSFLYDCKDCRDCFMCWNLRNKRYCYLNEELSKEDYFEKIKRHDLSDYSQVERLRYDFSDHFKKDVIHKQFQNLNSDNVTGDYIFNSKNVRDSFFADKCEDIAHCYDALENKDCMDTYECSIDVERQYECYGCNESSEIMFCEICQSSHNLQYCDYCFSCQECFGCIGLRNKKYCIFNKQYSKEDYLKLKLEIINHMKKGAEYGEFFPTTLSPYCYNESMAQEFYPLAEEEVKKKAWNWKDETVLALNVKKTINADKLPDRTQDIPDDVLNWALVCNESQRPFRLILQELKFYRTAGLSLPHLHPDIRHKNRISIRNPRKIFDRKCDKCSSEMKTSYSPERPEQVYCEECYLKEVY